MSGRHSRLSLVLALIVAAWALSACGGTSPRMPDESAARSEHSEPTSLPVSQPDETREQLLERMWQLFGQPAMSPLSKDEIQRLHARAEQGDTMFQSLLGYVYKTGRGGVTQDYGEAAKWYRKAAEQGLAGAQLSLGSMYAIGRGVPQDYTAAFRWIHKATGQGDESLNL